jgi:hypothetical protein
VTIPGVEMTLCNFDGIHDVDSGDVWDGLSARDLERISPRSPGARGSMPSGRRSLSDMQIARLIQIGVNIKTRCAAHIVWSTSACCYRKPFTSVKKPAPNDKTWGPTRLSCAPPRVAVSRFPIAFLQPVSPGRVCADGQGRRAFSGAVGVLFRSRDGGGRQRPLAVD